MKSVYLLTAMLVFGVTLLHAQVNTEALRIDSDKRGWVTTLRVTGNVSAGNTSIYETHTFGRVDYIRERNHAFIIADYRYGFKNEEPFKNAMFFAVRNTWQWRPKAAFEVFAQQQMDEFLRLKDRKLIGSGLRLTPIDRSKPDNTFQFRTHLGIGVMLEREVFDESTTDARFANTFMRSTNYLSMQLLQQGVFHVSAVQYLQTAATRLYDTRYIADLTLDLTLTKKTSLIFSLAYRFDNDPPQGVRAFDLNYTTGIRYTF